MNTCNKRIIKLSLYILLLLLLLIVSYFLFAGFSFNDYQKGIHIVSWSGLKAVFTDNDLQLFINEPISLDLNGEDGPYIIGDMAFHITQDNRMEKQRINRDEKIDVYVNNSDKDTFKVTLRDDLPAEESIFEMPPRLLAISDIEGNFNAFYSLLISNNVMDENYEWIFDDGHLVLVGDFVDRGSDVTQVLWLIYRLEQEALDKGGRVHFLLGNHEMMNIRGRTAYIDPRYIKAYQLISGMDNWDDACSYMFSDKTEIGKWIRSKNTAVRIGDILFVHGGFSPDILNYEISLVTLNTIFRENFDSDFSEKSNIEGKIRFLFGSRGPLWYRGLVRDYAGSQRLSETELTRILDYYDASGIVVGHCIVDDISADYNKALIMIDILHGKGKFSGKSKGLLIEGEAVYAVDDNGVRTRL